MADSIVPRSLPAKAKESDFEVTVADSGYSTKPRFETKTIKKQTSDVGNYSSQPKPGAAQKAATGE